MMPASVLNAARAQAATRRLDRTGELIPQIRTEDDSLGQTVTDGAPLPVNMGLAAGLSGQQELEQRLIDRIGNRPYFLALLPAGTVVSEDDKLRQLTPVIRKFRIIGVPNEGISFEVLRQVVVVEDEW